MKKAIELAAGVLAGALLLWPGSLSAQSLSAQVGEPGAYELEGVTVTSTRVERDLSRVPLTVSVVGEEQIREKPLPEPVEYVRKVPGVLVYNSNNFTPQFSLRGYRSDRTMLLVDGVRQRFATSLVAEGSGGLDVDPSEIERIEIVKGPASALYGSDAIGGVVNVITKGRSDRPFGGELGVVHDGSNDGFLAKAALHGALSGYWLRVSAARYRASDTRLPDGEVYHHTARGRDHLSAKFGRDWDLGSLEVFASAVRGRRDYPGIDPATAKQVDPSNMTLPSGESRYARVPREWRRQAGASLALTDLSPSVERVLASFHVFAQRIESDDKFNSFTAAGALNPAGLSTVFGFDESSSMGATVQADLVLPFENRLTVGVDWEDSGASSLGIYAGRLVNVGGQLNEDRAGGITSLAFFAQDEWTIADDWALTVGLRYTRSKNSLTRDLAFPARVSKRTYTNFVGSVGLVYTGLEGLSLRALYSQGFRAPTLDATMGRSQRSYPNPNLEPETSDNFEIGARYAGHGLSVDLALFHSELDKPFHYVSSGIPHPSGIRTYMHTINAVRAKSYGAELYADYEIGRLGLTPYVSITALTYEREIAPGDVSDDPMTPSSWGTGGLKFSRRVSERARVFSDASVTWSAGFHDKEGYLAPSAADLAYSSGWKWDWTFGLEYGEERILRASLSLRNIGDRPYEPWGYHQPGFHLVGNVAYEF